MHALRRFTIRRTLLQELPRDWAAMARQRNQPQEAGVSQPPARPLPQTDGPGDQSRQGAQSPHMGASPPAQISKAMPVSSDPAVSDRTAAARKWAGVRIPQASSNCAVPITYQKLIIKHLTDLCATGQKRLRLYESGHMVLSSMCPDIYMRRR